MSYATIDDLRSQLGKPAKSEVSAEYAAKMMHEIPDADVVDRAVFILQKVAGKRVLEFGASGKMHDAIVKAAAEVAAYDKDATCGVEAFDLDAMDVEERSKDDEKTWETSWTCQALPQRECDIIVCGEVIEHLANPGVFLGRLKWQYAGVPVVITVPNAFSRAARKHAERGVENVNADHVAWYSWKTMKTLLGRYGYEVKDFKFYNGDEYTAEGLIFVAE